MKMIKCNGCQRLGGPEPVGWLHASEDIDLCPECVWQVQHALADRDDGPSAGADPESPHLHLKGASLLPAQDQPVAAAAQRPLGKMRVAKADGKLPLNPGEGPLAVPVEAPTGFERKALSQLAQPQAKPRTGGLVSADEGGLVDLRTRAGIPVNKCACQPEAHCSAHLDSPRMPVLTESPLPVVAEGAPAPGEMDPVDPSCGD